jgi:osmotically-inducible protein OsmY
MPVGVIRIHQTNERKVMKKTSINTGKTLKVLGLVISLGALPLLLGVTGCSTSSHYQQSTGEHRNDQGTSSRVRAALAEDTEYKYGDVSVETFKGTVQLNGFVNSRDQKNRAGDLARNVQGVREVANYITVKESAN